MNGVKVTYSANFCIHHVDWLLSWIPGAYERVFKIIYWRHWSFFFNALFQLWICMSWCLVNVCECVGCHLTYKSPNACFYFVLLKSYEFQGHISFYSYSLYIRMLHPYMQIATTLFVLQIPNWQQYIVEVYGYVISIYKSVHASTWMIIACADPEYYINSIHILYPRPVYTLQYTLNFLCSSQQKNSFLQSQWLSPGHWPFGRSPWRKWWRGGNWCMCRWRWANQRWRTECRASKGPRHLHQGPPVSAGWHQTSRYATCPQDSIDHLKNI